MHVNKMTRLNKLTDFCAYLKFSTCSVETSESCTKSSAAEATLTASVFSNSLSALTIVKIQYKF